MEVTRIEQRADIKIAVHRGRNAMECDSELVEALGNNALPDRVVARRVGKFQQGRVSTTDEQRGAANADADSIQLLPHRCGYSSRDYIEVLFDCSKVRNSTAISKCAPFNDIIKWTVRDVEVVEDSNNYITHHITDLKPFTQYALYIRTYTTASGRQGAQSSIVYFKTEPDTPTPPVNIKARSTLHGEIVISWKPPKHPNGNVTYYIVEGIYEEDTSYFLAQRNYCLEPIAFPEYKKSLYDDESKHVGYFDNATTSSMDSSEEENCCPCTKDHRTLGIDDDDAEFQIHFEDFLHNKVYIKKLALYNNLNSNDSHNSNIIVMI
ncbi:putative molluscan insulin-related peptide(s) receptor receptor beta chain [Trichonephila clavipes]|nr:putative molluscan insulin-related peptide(s) receptor receptor beta chain [Trichonephila clavipes]